jgi:hypothetical protein
MNRKFFTLIAGFFMLAASLGTVSAQFGAGTAVDKFPKYPGEDNKLYQLTASETDDGTSQVFFLTVNADGVLDLDTVGALTPPAQFHATFGETLWCISFGTHVEGQNPKIDFTNKAHGLNLAVSADDAKSGKDFVNVKLGNLAGWGFSAAYKGDVEENKPLYTYADADNVLLLGIAERKSGDQTKDSLVVLKASAIDVVSKGVYPNGTLFFTIQEPAALWLTADQYNTILGTQKAGNVALKFDPEKANTLTVNPWSDQALFATPSSAGGAWLNFQIDKDEKTASGKGQTYVRVDTAYTNPTATGGGTQFLTFAYDTIVSNLNGYDLSGQYDFALRYYPSNDSIAIQVREVRYKPATGNWYAAAN